MVIQGFHQEAGSEFLITLADLGGHARRMPPYGTQFFQFHIHFWRKAPMSEAHTPQRVHVSHGKSWIRHWIKIPSCPQWYQRGIKFLGLEPVLFCHLKITL